MAALPLLATSSPQYQEAVATVIQRANLAYGDFIKSQEGVTFNGQVSCGVGEGETETPAGWTGLVLRPRALPSQHPSRRGRCSGPWTSPHQVCLIGDCVGGILAFDALCCSNQPVSESQSSSRRGSVASVQVRAPSSPQSRGPSGWRLCHPLAPNIPEACGKKEGLGKKKKRKGWGCQRRCPEVGDRCMAQVNSCSEARQERKRLQQAVKPGLHRGEQIRHHGGLDPLSLPAGERTQGPSQGPSTAE